MASRLVLRAIPGLVEKLSQRKDEFVRGVEDAMSKIKEQCMDESKTGEILQNLDALDRFFEQPIPALDDSADRTYQAEIELGKEQERKQKTQSKYVAIQRQSTPGLEKTKPGLSSPSEDSLMEPNNVKEIKLTITALQNTVNQNFKAIEKLQSELRMLRDTQSGQESCLENMELKQAAQCEESKQGETYLTESIDALHAEQAAKLNPLRQEIENLKGKMSIEVNIWNEKMQAAKSEFSLELGAFKDHVKELKEDFVSKLDMLKENGQVVDASLSREIETLRVTVEDLKGNMTSNVDTLKENAQTVDRNMTKQVKESREEVKKLKDHVNTEVGKLKRNVQTEDKKLSNQVQQLKTAGKTSEEEMARKIKTFQKEMEIQVKLPTNPRVTVFEDVLRQVSKKADKIPQVAFCVDVCYEEDFLGIEDYHPTVIFDVGNHYDTTEIPRFIAPVSGVYLSTLEVYEGHVVMKMGEESFASLRDSDIIVQNKENYIGRATYTSLVRLDKDQAFGHYRFASSLSERFRWSLILVQVS